jgi:hypothetical protein
MRKTRKGEDQTMKRESLFLTIWEEVAKALEISKGDRIIFCKDETGRIYIRRA